MKETQAEIKRLMEQLGVHQEQFAKIPWISHQLTTQQEQFNAMAQTLASTQVHLAQQYDSSSSSPHHVSSTQPHSPTSPNLDQ